LIRFARFMRTDLDRDLAVQPLEKVEQLVGRKTVEMPVHEVGDFWLFDAEQGGDVLLFELFVSK
jgi:hypothetical protein